MMTNTYTPIVGGLEKSIQTFSDSFRARGHEVKIVAPAFPDMPENEKDVVRVPSIEKFISTDFSVTLPLPELLQSLVADFKPDIVHSHHPFLMGDLALRLCGQNKIPLVFTYHTMFEHYTDHFAMDNLAMQKFVVELATGYAKMADQVIVPSESVGRILEERKVKRPIAVVPTGIDVERFAGGSGDFRASHGIPKNAFVVGHTGRLAPEKNLPFLTEAAAEFLKRSKTSHFLVVGRGPSEREMKKIFRAWGVLGRVHFAGVQKGKALVAAYHAMDVFAFASKSETQGIVIAEAMAAGLPVVGLDANGVREVVRDKKNGRLLALESRSKFSAALEWCAGRTKTQWEEVRAEALKTAKEFSVDVCAGKALAVYEKVLLQYKEGSGSRWRQWGGLIGRFKTELDMLLNLGRAAGSALVNTAVAPKQPKDVIGQLYQKQIEKFREEWMELLLKIRREARDIPEDERKRLDDVSETVTQKIRTYESEMTELYRRVLNSGEDFEKFMAGANQQMYREFEKVNAAPSGKPIISLILPGVKTQEPSR